MKDLVKILKEWAPFYGFYKMQKSAPKGEVSSFTDRFFYTNAIYHGVVSLLPTLLTIKYLIEKV